MNKKTIIYSISVLITSILFTGCGSDSKANGSEIARGTSALSIVYSSTSESNSGKMVGHYRVHAVDDNGKPISGLKLKMSLINGVKQIRNKKLQRATGDILTTAPISFHDNGVSFSQTDIEVGDTLIILPSAGKTDVSYLGDWTVSEIGSDLFFKEDSYHLESTQNLTYIVGNEERLLGGNNGNRGIVSVAHIQDVNNTFTTDEKGFTFFDVVFDPVLAGHTVTVGVHTEGSRLGISKVISLRGAKFLGSEITIPNTGSTIRVPMTLAIDPGNGGTEHLIDVDVNPLSFHVEPTDSCSINFNQSNFHTNGAGRVILAIDTKGQTIIVTDNNTTDSNTTNSNTTTTNSTPTTKGAETCTVKWDGGITSIYFEY